MLFRMLLGVGLTLYAVGKDHSLGPPKAQLILSILMLSPGRPVGAADIIDHVWGERPPPKAMEDLQSYVSRLRRRLREVVGDRVQILSRSGTYTLAVDSQVIDLHRFRALWRQASDTAARGELDRAIHMFREAEELWPGNALAGLPGDWAQRMGRTLADERAAARRERIDLELRIGRHRGVLEELRDHVARHPDDETLVAQLMTALYRADRRSDALDLYHRTRRYLREVRGTEPGPALRSLHLRVLRADSDLEVSPVPLPENSPPPDTLPPAPPHFIGREPEIGMVDAARGGEAPVVVVEGMAGVGKTALALYIAHRSAADHTDARLYLDLRAHDPARPPLSTDSALHELLRMLGVPAARIPSSRRERAALWHAELARRRALVILDDAAGPAQVMPLLGARSASLVLITTRNPFDGPEGLRRVPLGLLSREEAAKLACRVAGPDADPSWIDDIVRLCEGLPLAMTLEAARATGSTRGIQAGPLLGDTGQGRPGITGRTELDAVFEPSYRDLPSDVRAVYRRLGLSPGDELTPASAAALCETTQEVAREAMEVLVRHHMLQPAASGRYRFHGFIRGHAHGRAEREDPQGDNRRAVGRLLEHYLGTAEQAVEVLSRVPDPDGERPEEHRAMVSDARRWLGQEWRTVLLLADHAADHEWKPYTARIMRVMAEYLDMECLWEEAAKGHARALHACRDLGDLRGVAGASLDLGLARFKIGRYAEALVHTCKARSLYRSLGDRSAVARSVDQIGVIRWATAEYREALALHEEARAIYRSAGNVRGEAEALGHSGNVHWHLGRYKVSMDLLSRALETFRAIGDRRGEGKILNNMGNVQKHRGFHRDAVRLYQESMAIFKQIEGKQNRAILHSNLGDVQQYKHRFSAALESYGLAMATFLEIGDRRNQADILNSIGGTYLHMGGTEESRINFEKAKGIAGEIADDYQAVRALVGIADVNLATGRYEAARDTYEQAIGTARAIGDLYQEARAHRGLADTWERLDDLEATRISLRQALNLLIQLELPEAEEVRIRLDGLGGDDGGF
ncbi:tetratricopeptide repeat protein [Sphaerisporangium sp. NPDC051017]|uniref:AfsR/SARP family transcriptional regulator n=1 Tax=Sphaerisporangium sp. NPDC051017 TaxID=3154636 RepID=UPI0034388FD0